MMQCDPGPVTLTLNVEEWHAVPQVSRSGHIVPQFLRWPADGALDVPTGTCPAPGSPPACTAGATGGDEAPAAGSFWRYPMTQQA